MKDRREAILSLMLRLRAMSLPPRLLAAFEAVPRQNFVPVMHLDASYGPAQLPIECGQTMTSPDLIARLLLVLDVQPEHRVLELGTGTGYQAAVLGKLGEHVMSLERWRTLAEKAQQRLAIIEAANVRVELADGKGGWPGGLYDRIIANFAYGEIPRHFIDQLATNGVALVPVGPDDGPQKMMRLVKVGSRFEASELFEVRMQPFIEGVAQAI